MSGLILQTKLFKPAPRPSLIARPQLIDRLNEGLGHGKEGFAARLTLVSAPAGFGKTTLVADWLSQLLTIESGRASLATAWLSLDEGDNDFVRFVTYLVAALQTAAPHTGQTALQALQSSPSSPAETVLTLLINDVSQHALPLVLVLDDYHLITSTSVHQAMIFLLDHLPPQLHLLVTSRSDPPLPLSRLRARSQMIELRIGDLRFTSDEARRFLHQAMGLSLSPKEIAALEQRTEGWVAGLQLAGLSLRGRADQAELIAAFTGSHRFVIDYLSEEVLRRESETVRDFLLSTSILERLCSPLADALTGTTSGQTMLEYLEQGNLFLTALDNERRWYRYHPLFAEVLRRHLLDRCSERLEILHHRASEWYEQHGFLAEALSHAFKGRQIERAAALLEKAAPAWLEAGTVSTLRNWLNALPEEMLRTRPQLNLAYAYVLTFMGNPAGFKARLQETEKMLHEPNALSEGERNDMLAEVAALKARAAFDRNESIDVDDLRSRLARVSAANTRVQGILALAVGHAERVRGNMAEAASYFTRAATLARERGDRVQAVYTMGFLADLQEAQGLLRQAFQTYQQTLQLATSAEGKPLSIAATACIGLGKLHYEWNDLEQAAGYLQQGMKLGQQSGVEAVELYSAMSLAMALQGLGDSSGAEAMIQRAASIAERWALPPLIMRVAAQEARLWLMRGQWQLAARWVEAYSIATNGEISEATEVEYCILARLLIARQEPDEALPLLARLHVIAENGGRLWRLIEVLALQALAFQAAGNNEQAVDTLERTLALAEAEGFCRVFVDENRPMAKLLQKTRQRDVHVRYVDRLLQAFATEEGLSQPVDALPDPLSVRELEVLRLAATGASNKDIARELFIALSTVKKHMGNILVKLDAQSRVQAVTRAREVGLL